MLVIPLGSKFTLAAWAVLAKGEGAKNPPKQKKTVGVKALHGQLFLLPPIVSFIFNLILVW